MKYRKNVRLPSYDYSSDGYYFITICTHRFEPLLRGPNGRLVERIVNELPNKVNGLGIDYCQVMDTHVHLILTLAGCNMKLGQIIRQFKAAASRTSGISLWQPNYYEHVIRSETALANVREYIKNNPIAQDLKSAPGGL